MCRLNPLVSTLYNWIQVCGSARAAVCHSAAMCGSMWQCGSGSVRQCGSAAAFTEVRKYAAVVRAAVCGSARGSLCLFVFDTYMKLNLT
jgi:hypothetical protein